VAWVKRFHTVRSSAAAFPEAVHRAEIERERRANIQSLIMMRHCALTALAVLCLSGGGHVVRGQDNSGPSCSDLGVTDAKSCDKYCGGPSADMMPSSMWLNGATCTCQNCMLRDCKGGSTCFNPPGGCSRGASSLYPLRVHHRTDRRRVTT
jgi:hypothetical protein